MEESRILILLEQLLKLSATGEHFSKDEYNRERYKTISERTAELYALVPGFQKLQINALDKVGYITPKVGVNAIIENANGTFLFEKRMDDKCWGIPGGWAETGFTAEQNVIREMKEETGLNVKVISLLDVICRNPSPNYIHTSYHVVFKCEIVSGELKRSHESEALEWKKINEIDKWHFDHKEWMERILKIKNRI